MDALDNQLGQIKSQNETDWLQLRIGKFTASEIHRLMSEPKSKTETLSEGAKTYVLEKIAERFTGIPCKQFESSATEWGHDHEHEARIMFSKKFNLEIDQVGFYSLSDDAGGSPDGIIFSEKSIVEIKCPFNSANHIDHLLIDSDDKMKRDFKEYYWQIQMNMLCSETEQCHFISYDPRMKDELKIFHRIVKRNDEDIIRIESKLQSAITMLNATIIYLSK